MKRFACLVLCIVLTMGLLPAEVFASEAPSACMSEWIVEFKEHESASSFADERGGKMISPLDVLVAGGTRLGYLLRPDVVSVTANGTVEGCASEFVYDDPMLPTSKQVGSSISFLSKDECQFYMGSIGMFSGWPEIESYLDENDLSPEPVVVAVLDSGVDGTHPDLANRVGEGYDIISNCEIPAGTDSDVSISSHGTMTAGLIAAEADNGIGMAGVAGTYPVTIMPVRVLNEYDTGTVADTVAGIYWAADHGAQVLNLSYGSRMSTIPDAMQTAVDYARSKGCYIIAAAGNDGKELDSFHYHYYPASLDGVIAVGALNRSNNYLSSSNRPANGTAGKSYYCMPGEGLLTTIVGDSYGLFTGTSASCALFSGVISLFLSVDASRLETCLACGTNIHEGNSLGDTETSVSNMIRGLSESSYDAYFVPDADNPQCIQDGVVVLFGTTYVGGRSGTSIRFDIEYKGTNVGTYTYPCSDRERITLTAELPGRSRETLYIYATILDESMNSITIKREVGSVSMDSGSYLYQSSIVVQDADGNPISGANVTAGSIQEITDRNGQAFFSSSYFRSGYVTVIEGDGFSLVTTAKLPMDSTADPMNRIFIRVNGGNLLSVRGSAETFGNAEIFGILPDGSRARLYSLDPDGTASFRLEGCTKVYLTTQAPDGRAVLLSCDVSENTFWDLDSALASAVQLDIAAVPDENGNIMNAILLCLDGDAAGITAPVLVSTGTWDVDVSLRRTLSGKTYFANASFGTIAISDDTALSVGSGQLNVTTEVSPSTLVGKVPATAIVRVSDSYGNPVTYMGTINTSGLPSQDLGALVCDYDEVNPDTPSSSRITLTSGNDDTFTYRFGTTSRAFGTHRLIITPEVAESFNAVVSDTNYTIVDPSTITTATVNLNITVSGVSTVSRSQYVLMQTGTNGYDAAAFSADSVKLPVGKPYTVVSMTYGSDGNLYLVRTTVDLSTVSAGSTVTRDVTFTSDAASMTFTGGKAGAVIWTPFEELPMFQMRYAAANTAIGKIFAIGCGENEPLEIALSDPSAAASGIENTEYYTVAAEVDLSQSSVMPVGTPITLSIDNMESSLLVGETLRITPKLTDAKGNVVTRLRFLSGTEEIAGGASGFTVSVNKLDGSVTKSYTPAFGETVIVNDLPKGTYTVRVSFTTPARRNSECNLAAESYLNVVTEDGSNVPAPHNVHAVTRSTSVIELTWSTAAEDAIYQIWRDAEMIAETDETSYSDSGLTQDRFYCYTIYTMLGSRKSDGAIAVGTTYANAVTPSSIPSTPVNPEASFTEKGLRITWDDVSGDRSSVTGYIVNVNGEDRMPVFYRTDTITRYVPGQTLTLTVRAVNSAGQESEPCAPITMTAPDGTRVMNAKADYGYSRLNVFAGNEMTVSADTTGDVTSVVCETVYTDASGRHTHTIDMTDSGEHWTADVTLPFFITVDQVTVKAIVGADVSASADCAGFPVSRAGNYTVELDPLLMRTSLIDLSTCTVTLTSPSLNYSVSQTADDFSGILTYSLADADDYILTVSDAGGAVFLRKTGVSVLNGGSITLTGYDVNVLGIIGKADDPSAVEGAPVTVGSEDGQDIHTGIADAAGQIIFENNRPWFMATPDTVYTISCEPYEVTYSDAFGDVRKEFTTAYTPADQTINYTGRIGEIRYYMPKPDLRKIPVSFRVVSYGQPLAGIPVKVASNYEVLTLLTDENGMVRTEITINGDNVVAAGVEDIRLENGVYAVPHSILLTGSADTLEVVQLYHAVRFTADVYKWVDSTTVLIDEPLEWTLNGKPCMVCEDGSIVCYSADVVRGESVKLKCVRAAENGVPIFTEKSVVIDRPGIVDAGEFFFDRGQCYIKLVAENHDGEAIRYLLYSSKTGTIIRDVVSKDGATFMLPCNTVYRAVAVTNTKSFDPVDIPTIIRSGQMCELNEGETALIQTPLIQTPAVAPTYYYADETGFSKKASCTWLDDTTVRVLTWVTLWFKKAENVCDYYAELSLPAGAFDISTELRGGVPVIPEISDHDGSPVIKLTRSDEINSGFSIISIAFTAPEAALRADHTLEMDVGVTLDGIPTRSCIAEQTISFAPVDISTPETINQNRMKDGIPVYVFSSLANKENWTLSLLDGDELLYSSRLSDVPACVRVWPENDLLGAHTLTAKVRKGDLIYEDKWEYEVIDDRRPAMLSAAYGDLDLMDLSHAWPLYGHLCKTVKAEFTNSYMVQDVRFVVRYAQYEEYYPLVRNGSVFSSKNVIVSSVMQPVSVRIDYVEIPNASVSYGEIRTDPDDIDSYTFVLPEGAAFMDLPEEYGGSPEQKARDDADWQKYLAYAVSGVFVNGNAEAVNATLDDLFGSDDVWYLPPYLTAEGYLIRLSMNRNGSTSEDAIEMTVNGIQRPVGIYAEQTGNSAYIRYEGLGDLFFPVFAEDSLYAANLVDRLTPERLEKFQMGMEAYGYAKAAKELSDVDPEHLEEAIGPLTDLLPYGGDAAKMAAQQFQNIRDNRFKQIEDMFCRAGETQHCPGNNGNGEGDNGNGEGDNGNGEGDNGNGEGDNGNGEGGKSGKPVTSLIDPSGYVFEATEENRVGDVKATIYQKVGSSWYVWNSEPFKEPENPSLTNEFGEYGWNVPSGSWKVVFSKDGYALAESEILSVPPEHLDVNISIVSSKAPALSSVLAMADGRRIRLAFDTYMSVDSLTEGGTVRAFFGTEECSASLAALDPVISTSGNKQLEDADSIVPGRTIAKVFWLTLDNPLPVGALVNLKLSSECIGYNLKSLPQDESISVIIPEEDPVIPADSIRAVDGDLIRLNANESISLFPHLLISASDAAPKLIWESSDPEIVEVGQNGTVTARGVGTVTVSVTDGSHSVDFAVSAARQPITPKEEENQAFFCRTENLVAGKRCWLYSQTAAGQKFPIPGDRRYVPVSWTISENDTVMASGTVDVGTAKLEVPYYPQTAGAICCGAITYMLQEWDGSIWTDTGITYTATRTLLIVSVTGISVKSAPPVFSVGDTLNLSELTLNITFSDGSVSEAPYSKFSGYGIVFSIPEGTVLTAQHRELIITHTDSGQKTSLRLFSQGDPYTVTFDANGGRVTPTSGTTDVGGKITSLPTPTRIGSYVFNGWYTAANGGTKVTIDKIYTEDTTIYAHWTYTGGGGGGYTPIIYTLTFNTNGGSAISKISDTYDTLITLDKYVPTKDGFEFGGWYADSALTTPIDEIKLTGNKTVYAKWIEKSAVFPFTDVKETDWSYDDIYYVWEKGLMQGTSETTFAPKIDTSRAMIVTILWRLEGEPIVNYAMSFDDVADGQWYTEAIRWAQANNIVNGYSAEKFGPTDLITREQMAAILYRYAQSKGEGYTGSWMFPLDFKDAADVSDWANEAMHWCVMKGLINGVGNNLLDPQGLATREQVAAILHRFCENIVK